MRTVMACLPGRASVPLDVPGGRGMGDVLGVGLCGVEPFHGDELMEFFGFPLFSTVPAFVS